MSEDWEIDYWIKQNVPDKQTISRDAVEILIRLAWVEARKATRRHVETEKEADRWCDL